MLYYDRHHCTVGSFTSSANQVGSIKAWENLKNERSRSVSVGNLTKVVLVQNCHAVVPFRVFFVITMSKMRLGGRDVILVSTLCFRQRDSSPPL